MASWMRDLLTALLVVGVVWSAAVAYWRDAVNMPSPLDLLLVMLGLPLLLLTGLWFGRKLFAPSSAAAAPGAAGASASAASPSSASTTAPALAIVASSLRMPHGESPAELLAALERGNARATLDPELTGDDGYPIMSVRAAAADDADAREQIGAWIDSHGHAGQARADGVRDDKVRDDGVRDDGVRDEYVRALLLGAGVAAELGALAADEFIPHGQDAPSLQLALLLPSAWSAGIRRLASYYLRQAVADNGWPEEKIVLQLVDDASAVLAGGAKGAPVTLLLACASHVGEHTVNAWSADLTLFSAAHQQGMIPGEGAAGLLLTAALEPADHRAYPLVSGVAALRDSSADSERRPDGSLLAGLVARALEGAALPAYTLGAVVADTGHRTGRLMELMGLVRDTAPHLDAGSDVLSTGAASGSCAEAGFIAALALAAQQADTLKAPVLCVANEDPFRRCAMVVRPAQSAISS